MEPRYQLDRDSICYGCQYFKAVEDCDDEPYPDNVQCGGVCDCIEMCVAGSRNMYEEVDPTDGCGDCRHYPCGHSIAGADSRECDGYEKN